MRPIDQEAARQQNYRWIHLAEIGTGVKISRWTGTGRRQGAKAEEVRNWKMS